MKFYIRRTTGSYNNEPPCAKATLLNPDRGEWDDPEFGIEVNTIEELVELMKSSGHPIILEHTYNDEKYSPYELEIYDGYRE